MILHDFALSSASYRVRIALNLKGLSYERRSWQLRSGVQRSEEYLAINPAGLLPTLEIDGLRLAQSIAIMQYIDARWPAPPLIPADPAERARAMAIALTIACDIHPLNNLRVLQYLEHELALEKTARDHWYARWVHAGFSTIESILSDGKDHPYASGAAPGIADLCIVPQIYNARRYNVDLSAYPVVVAIADRANRLPAFAAAAPAPE